MERTPQQAAAGNPADASAGHDSLIMSVEGLTKKYAGVAAVDRLSIGFASGSITGIVGPNGAGKTTLFGLISGTVRADEGSISYLGREIRRLSPRTRARIGIARTFQTARFFTSLSVRENLLVAAELGPERRRAERAVADLLARLDLAEIADRPADELSTGTGRLVEVGRALAVKPRFLLLDEPAAGQDAEETRRFAALLRALADDGTTVILVEHDMSLVMGVCDQVHVLDLGKIIASGPPEVIRRDQTVLAAYLGDA